MMRNPSAQSDTVIGHVVAIGVVKSPYLSREQAPKQGREALSESSLHVFPQYREALQGLTPDSYAFILTWFDQANRKMLKAHPRGDKSKDKRGIFSTRSPDRPNPIALNLVRIITVDETGLRVEGMDALDGTRILDIKPFVKAIDVP